MTKKKAEPAPAPAIEKEKATSWSWRRKDDPLPELDAEATVIIEPEHTPQAIQAEAQETLAHLATCPVCGTAVIKGAPCAVDGHLAS
jgi:hypothetical protein